MNELEEVVAGQKQGQVVGIPSICSAHPLVLEAAMFHSLSGRKPVLIESTCNQVNQFGGYTGMTPVDFAKKVGEIADKVGFPRSRLFLGGDHYGPLPWAHQPAGQAMENAKTLVRDSIFAGYRKIHLDSSVACAGEQNLAVEEIARRNAELALEAEEASRKVGVTPCYVIGSEVPTAGGAKIGENVIHVTRPEDAINTIDLTYRAFIELGLDQAWKRVIALVVQPGVDYGDQYIHVYDPGAATGLARNIETVPGLIFEAHSTDYQPRRALRALVKDHFAILKVGPALTFAFREGVVALCHMEKALMGEQACSGLLDTLESAMLENPVYWQQHYGGTPEQQKFARLFSYSDRLRYYWADARVEKAFQRLMDNLGDSAIPPALLSQYLPVQYEKVRENRIRNTARGLLIDKVISVLEDYSYACEGRNNH